MIQFCKGISQKKSKKKNPKQYTLPLHCHYLDLIKQIGTSLLLLLSSSYQHVFTPTADMSFLFLNNHISGQAKDVKTGQITAMHQAEKKKP